MLHHILTKLLPKLTKANIRDTLQHFKIRDTIQRHKKSLSVAAALLFVLLVYRLFFVTSPTMPAFGSKIVEIAPAERRDIEQTAEFIGTIRSQHATTLIAKSSGILQQTVDSGQHIKKNDLIAKIENNDIERNHRLSEEAEKIAQSQYDRASQLIKSGVFSQNTVEEKKNAWIESQKKSSDAKIALDQINVYAPFDGIVGLFKIQAGSQIQEGDALVSFYDPSSLIVEFDVPLSIMRYIRDANPVIVDHQRYVLTHIQKMMDEDTHMCPAYVKITCKDCIIGDTTRLELIVQEKPSVIVIPYESLFLREGKPYVYVVKDDKAVLTAVETGIREKTNVEIVSGLHEGDRVIIRGQARLYPDVPVKIAPDTKTDVATEITSDNIDNNLDNPAIAPKVS